LIINFGSDQQYKEFFLAENCPKIYRGCFHEVGLSSKVVIPFGDDKVIIFSIKDETIFATLCFWLIPNPGPFDPGRCQTTWPGLLPVLKKEIE
jgi:hypothetical protein